MKANPLVHPVVLALCLSAGLRTAAGDPPPPINVRLNDVEILLDADTGAILKIERPGVGTILEATREKAGLIEAACPLPEFEPLRLASRFSKARIEVTEKAVTIHYDRLGSSRTAFNQRADVAAKVTLAAAGDNKSLVFSCRIDNRSDRPIPQLLFPDLVGLLPTAGEPATQLRTCGGTIHPWTEMRSNPSGQFWVDDRDLVVLEPGRLLSNMILRWLDLGGSRGGISMFAKRWGWDPVNRVYADMNQQTMRLRLMWEHADAIPPGQTYESGEFWLTPHRHGWAEGIEPYRRWFTQNYKRLCPMPGRIRDGLGFRTAWMSQCVPDDPAGDVVWRFSDLPALATEAREHGLVELSVWYWNRRFHLPIPEPYPQLGTTEELVSAARQCDQAGVPVALFVSLLGADPETAERHGYAWKKRGSYTRHTDLLPRRGAWYTSTYDYSYADVRNKGWQADVRKSMQSLIDKGLANFTWDQVKITNDRGPGMAAAIQWVREYARQKMPASSFGGESTSCPEIDLGLVDYTWNWRNYSDTRPLTSLLTEGPRINVNIHDSVQDAVLAFADNLYLNVMPRKPEDINGSDWIKNHPELSRRLQQYAQLRRQFLPYFTRGTLVGDCVHVQPDTSIHLTGYALQDRMLVIAVNTAQRQKTELELDVEPWLVPQKSPLELRILDSQGRSGETRRLHKPQFTVATPSLEPWDLCIVEIAPPAK